MSKNVTETPEGFSLFDDNRNYSLDVHKDPRITGIDQGLIYILPSKSKKDGVLVTGRDYSEYPREVRNLELNPDKQYIEVGAGLGGFMPELVNRLKGELTRKPIVIDLVNYRLVGELFDRGIEEARNRGYHSTIIDRLETLKGRANFYLNSQEIRLINLSLGNAIRTFPELVGCGDIVVDNIATEQYPHVEFELSDTETRQMGIARANKRCLTTTFGDSFNTIGSKDFEEIPIFRITACKSEDVRINRITEMRRKLAKQQGIVLGD